MQDKRRKQDVRALVARTGLGYTSALRILEGQQRLAAGVDEMLDRLRALLAERPLNRLWLVHGFEREAVTPIDLDTVWLDIAEHGVHLTVTQPVVWEIEPGHYPARASDIPSTDEVDILETLLTNYVDSGALGDARLTDWRVERDLAELPSAGKARDAMWTVTATIVAT